MAVSNRLLQAVLHLTYAALFLCFTHMFHILCIRMHCFPIFIKYLFGAESIEIRFTCYAIAIQQDGNNSLLDFLHNNKNLVQSK